MKPNFPEWIDTALRSWHFYWTNLRTSIDLVVLSFLFIGAAAYLNSPGNLAKAGDYSFSIGSNLLLIGIFSIFYEVRTREAFRKMLAEINPNIESGVTVHPSYQKVMTRDVAIGTYAQRKDVIRIRTSTADNYVKHGEPANSALQDKILSEQCDVRILLYLPVLQEGLGLVGQHGEEPKAVLLNQLALLDSYKAIISLAPRRVAIRFCVNPLHVNFIMLGNDRMFSSIIPNIAKSGISTPCFEIFPTGQKSLFFQFQQEFDSIFGSKDPRVSLDFNLVEPLLRNSHGDIAVLRPSILALGGEGAHPAVQGTLRDKAAQRP